MRDLLYTPDFSNSRSSEPLATGKNSGIVLGSLPAGAGATAGTESVNTFGKIVPARMMNAPAPTSAGRRDLAHGAGDGEELGGGMASCLPRLLTR